MTSGSLLNPSRQVKMDQEAGFSMSRSIACDKFFNDLRKRLKLWFLEMDLKGLLFTSGLH